MSSPTTILLAEDDIILAELYTDRLKQEGFNVVHANNGEDALKFVKEYKPALIILDIMMPKMNGLDVLKQIKENPAMKNTPVIIVTALVQEIEKISKMMTQADAYLVKSEVLPGEIIDQVKKRLQAAGAKPAPAAEAAAQPKLEVAEGGAPAAPAAPAAAPEAKAEDEQPKAA